MSKELKEVRILILGESGVGKTSLILSLVSEQFMDDNLDPSFELPAKLEPITIPAEVTLEKIPGVIIDFSFREQTEQDLINEIEKASVICLVYSIENETSKEKLISYWMPKIQEIEDSLLSQSFTEQIPSKRPIVLVGNKTDTNLDRNNPTQDSLITQLIRSNSQIETCIMCSAKTLKNVPEVFYYAQKSVLYPTSPVYDVDRKQLTQLAIKCFTRIFKLCDMDNDGRLNDNELNEFQLKCFGIRLNSNSLQEVKTLLNSNNENLIENEITLKGFLYLQMLFFKKGRHETSWTVLKKFGYDKNLSLSREFSTLNLKVPESCSVELSQKCFEFLQFLFKKYDKDKDGCLNKEELNELFSVCPIMPWGKDVHNTIETDSKGNITYCGFLSQWILTTYFDLKTSFELLAYLGYNNYYDENQNSAFVVSRPKDIDITKKQTFRNVFLCYVYGRKKCGKTAFLQGLLGRDLQYQATINPDDITRWSCNLVQFQNIEKYLILKEINASDLDMHEAYPPDVVILMYDVTDPNSFSFIADIFLSIYKDRPIPCILVGTKSDQTEIVQKYPLTVEKFAEFYRLPPPQYFSASTNLLHSCDIFQKIVAVAFYPKMYPMRSQIWSFFQKLGAAAQAATSHGKKTRPETTNNSSNLSIFNPLYLFSKGTDKKMRPKSTIDPDSMLLRYTFLTATCLTMAFLLFKMIKKR
ncbi:unnamed protein product [Brachionus calyciflorus]|uniref:Mitochondrial Rho GTPase n=1 Tax=Brachionus calyciflorus TaxID=104777 RepID=A0A813NU43_9BILA|nr:unnamed protein product [Brachionus calyciflorus]